MKKKFNATVLSIMHLQNKDNWLIDTIFTGFTEKLCLEQLSQQSKVWIL